MIIASLAENTSISPEFGSEHGLSLYLEACHRRVLFDTGASGLFAKNAERLNIDLSLVELAVLSHGHYDHGGGLREFLKINMNAKIYVRQGAFDSHYFIGADGSKRYIGLDETLLPNRQFVFTGDYYNIEPGLELFSGVTGKRLRPFGGDLYMQSGGQLVPDDFSHEQDMILEEDGKMLLLSGCAHNGIINIMERCLALKGRYPDYVVGGFHLSGPASGWNESPAVLAEIAAFLMDTGARFYTCHCTGLESYRKLKELMADRICYLSAGGKIEL